MNLLNMLQFQAQSVYHPIIRQQIYDYTMLQTIKSLLVRKNIVPARLLYMQMQFEMSSVGTNFLAIIAKCNHLSAPGKYWNNV